MMAIVVAGGGGGVVVATFACDFKTCHLIVVALQIGLVRFSDRLCVYMSYYIKQANYIKWMESIYALRSPSLLRCELQRVCIACV